MSLINKAITFYQKEGLRPFLTRTREFFQENGVGFTLYRVSKLGIAKVLESTLGKKRIAKSALLTSFYFYARGTFQQEQQAILYGHLKYDESENDSGNLYKVIRDTHRVEKGLSMKDRRDVFAEGYIKDLVEALDQYVREAESIDRQVQWSFDVLHKYFDVVEKTDIITQAESQFQETVEQVDYEPGDKNPTLRDEIEVAPTSYGSLKKLAEQRRSTRWFEQRPVPEEKLDKALEIASLSPSACNRQPYEFKIYTGEDAIQDILSLPLGVQGYKENIPALAVLVGKQRAYFDERDKNIIYIDTSLAAMSFQFALETLGLASTCINWPVVPENKRDIREKIPMSPDEQIIMLMAIGYPDEEGMIPYSEKKPLDKIRSYDNV